MSLGRNPDRSAAEALSAAWGLLTALIAMAYLLVDEVTTRAALSELATALCVVGLGLACLLTPKAHRLPGVLLLLGMVLIGVGDIVGDLDRIDGAAPYPHGGELWAAAGTVSLLTGVVILVGRRRAITAQERLDIGIGTVSLLLFAASSGLISAMGMGEGQLVAAAFFAVATLAVAVGVLVVSRPETSRAGMWLVFASLSLVCGDAGFLVATSSGWDVDGRVTDVGHLLARGVLVVMALSLARGGRPSADEVARRRVLVAGAFALLVPAGFLVGADTGVQNPVWLTVLACSTPIALLTWRAVRSVDDLALVAGLDPLTGLGNRRAFDHRLASACDNGVDAVLLVADLDGFKRVNDTRGHGAGDQVLLAVARGLRDSSPDAFVARLGGDEFAVLVPGAVEPGPAQQDLVDALRPVLADNPGLGVSVGAARNRPGATPGELLAEADAAMYAAKQATRSLPGGGPDQTPGRSAGSRLSRA